MQVQIYFLNEKVLNINNIFSALVQLPLLLPRGQLPLTPKLTLSQSLTLTGGNFPRRQLSGCPQP